MKRTIPLAIALLVGLVSVMALVRDASGIRTGAMRIGATPATLYESRTDPGGPLVFVAHGFAGSQRLMEPLALHLAGRGYRVVTWDFLGHGRHPLPFSGTIQDQEGAARVLMNQTSELVAGVRQMLAPVAPYAIAGHSMATNIVVRVAQESEGQGVWSSPVATVGISMFAPTLESDSPWNVLSIAGAFERRLLEEGRRMVSMALDGDLEAVSLGARVGTFSDGSARMVIAAPRVEHVGVLYSATTLTETGDWLDAAFGRTSTGDRERGTNRGRWILLLLLCLPVLAWSLIPNLPRALEGHDRPITFELPTKRWAPLWWGAGVPALLTPLLLRPLPTGFLPVVVADYLALHFALFGILAGGVAWIRAGRPGVAAILSATGIRSLHLGRTVLAIVAVATFFLLVLALPLDRYFTAFFPITQRLPLVFAMLAGTIPYFLADEWLTRSDGVPRGAYALTKGLFLVSLGLAVALDVQSLFFLVIIFPVILLFFVAHGFFSRWIFEATGSPVVAAVGNALAFAWAMGVTFPLYAGPG